MKLKRRFIQSLIIFSMCTIQMSCQDDGWVDLFNGKDLTGWKKIGGNATYEVINGEIVGISASNKFPPADPMERSKLKIEDFPLNTFLITEEAYTDFMIELELKVGNMNGGIQFRSNSDPDYFNGIFHGYQCEVDPSERAWSAGVYDEMGRGWLYPLTLNPDAGKSLKLNDWNVYRIECIGPNIRTWLNNTPVAHLVDDMHSKGHFGLQVHFTFNEEQVGERISWRNIRIKTKNLVSSPPEDIFVANYIPNDLSEVEATQGWKLLFDGAKTLGLNGSASKESGAKGWDAQNGVLVATSNGEGAVTNDQFEAFDLQFEFQTMTGSEGGIAYFSGSGTPGLVYMIRDDDSVIDSVWSGSLQGLIPANQVRKHPGAVNPSTWNRGRIIAYQDGKVEHWLNGVKVLEFVRTSDEFFQTVSNSSYAGLKDFNKFKKAPIEFMVRENTINFRSIKIKELDR